MHAFKCFPKVRCVKLIFGGVNQNVVNISFHVPTQHSLEYIFNHSMIGGTALTHL